MTLDTSEFVSIEQRKNPKRPGVFTRMGKWVRGETKIDSHSSNGHVDKNGSLGSAINDTVPLMPTVTEPPNEHQNEVTPQEQPKMNTGYESSIRNAEESLAELRRQRLQEHPEWMTSEDRAKAGLDSSMSQPVAAADLPPIFPKDKTPEPVREANGLVKKLGEIKDAAADRLRQADQGHPWLDTHEPALSDEERRRAGLNVSLEPTATSSAEIKTTYTTDELVDQVNQSLITNKQLTPEQQAVTKKDMELIETVDQDLTDDEKNALVRAVLITKQLDPAHLLTSQEKDAVRDVVEKRRRAIIESNSFEATKAETPNGTSLSPESSGKRKIGGRLHNRLKGALGAVQDRLKKFDQGHSYIDMHEPPLTDEENARLQEAAAEYDTKRATQTAVETVTAEVKKDYTVPELVDKITQSYFDDEPLNKEDQELIKKDMEMIDQVYPKLSDDERETVSRATFIYKQINPEHTLSSHEIKDLLDYVPALNLTRAGNDYERARMIARSPWRNLLGVVRAIKNPEQQSTPDHDLDSRRVQYQARLMQFAATEYKEELEELTEQAKREGREITAEERLNVAVDVLTLMTNEQCDLEGHEVQAAIGEGLSGFVARAMDNPLARGALAITVIGAGLATNQPELSSALLRGSAEAVGIQAGLERVRRARETGRFRIPFIGRKKAVREELTDDEIANLSEGDLETRSAAWYEHDRRQRRDSISELRIKIDSQMMQSVTEELLKRLVANGPLTAESLQDAMLNLTHFTPGIGNVEGDSEIIKQRKNKIKEAIAGVAIASLAAMIDRSDGMETVSFPYDINANWNVEHGLPSSDSSAMGVAMGRLGELLGVDPKTVDVAKFAAKYYPHYLDGAKAWEAYFTRLNPQIDLHGDILPHRDVSGRLINYVMPNFRSFMENYLKVHN